MVLEIKCQGHSGHNLVSRIETKPLCVSSSNLTDMLTMVGG